MTEHRSARPTRQVLLISAFALIAALLAILSMLAVQRVEGVDEKLELVALERERTRAIQEMRRTVRERFIRLNLITLSDDPFVQDELQIEFQTLAGQFISARAQLQASSGDNPVALGPLLSELGDLTSTGSPIQAAVLEAALSGDRVYAQTLLMDQSLPIQLRVVAQLERIQDLLDAEHALSQAALDDALDRTRRQVITTAIAGLLLVLLIGTLLVRRVGQQQAAMQAEISRRTASEQALHAAHAELENKVAERTNELSRTTDLLSNVLSAATDFSIIATDPNGQIIVFNSGAERMLGYRASEVVGHHTPALFHLPEEVAARSAELSTELGRPIEGFTSFVEKAEREGSETREWTYRCKDGQLKAVQLTVTAWRNTRGQIRGYLGIAEDISERKRIESMKNEFISTVSHELRTPLTAITGALGLVSSGHIGILTEPMSEMLRISTRNAQRLGLLINDLLDMEKLIAGKLRFELQEQALCPLVEQAVRDNQAYADRFEVRLQLVPGPDAQVRVDADRLQQVLANLLSNAAKFSPQGGCVEIDVRSAQERVRVSVSDHGPGIPAAFRERIFQKFSQADASDARQRGGTGLGLAISRELVERMGGTIGFESVEGRGATFWFEFPACLEGVHA